MIGLYFEWINKLCFKTCLGCQVVFSWIWKFSKVRRFESVIITRIYIDYHKHDVIAIKNMTWCLENPKRNFGFQSNITRTVIILFKRICWVLILQYYCRVGSILADRGHREYSVHHTHRRQGDREFTAKPRHSFDSE